jgi:hypothetical protein
VLVAFAYEKVSAKGKIHEVAIGQKELWQGRKCDLQQFDVT